ncbi:MAG TPA: hypothetical protein DIU06_01985 [Rhodospirillaceae bacterium]|nr:hypothetical protein [Rhodospirillaceae bacterium]
MSFEELGLSENLLKAIKDCGYETPTPIQAGAIPHVLMARDVVGLAQTGTGKTASFTLPMIEILDGGRAKARMPRSLILSPTRELAAQIAENFEMYGKYTNLSMALLVGGVSMDEQIKKLDRGVDVLIATPGRLLDLFERGRILLTDIKILVIDEADRMLDMGFIPDIEKIVSKLSPMRQTLLFSATMPAAIKKLTEKFLSNPREVSVSAPASTAKNVEQFMIWTHKRAKDDELFALIEQENPGTAFIFCNRKRDIDGLCKALRARGYDAKALHGDMDQKSRTSTLEELRDGNVRFLVCSDVAGRGIDVDHITHVFNYDVPMNADDYVHRIGRTGRAGRKGRAFMLADKKYDEKFVAAIEEIIKKPVPVQEPLVQKNAKKTAAPEKSAKPYNKNKKPRGKDRVQDEEIVGFGDDIPSFMK